jgi:FixJ family two-component response regulator
MVAEDVSAGRTGLSDRMRVLLIEDDDGDALLVDELLLDAGAPFALTRARSLAEARPALSEVGCVLLDLELPDSRGLRGVRLLQEIAPSLAVVVLTGLSDEHLGEQAVRAGAQDYLVKGQVDGFLLHRVVRYAVERRRAEETQRQLAEARLYAAENSRLERGLLPSPLVSDPRLTIASRYRAGGGQMLLGGDFYDAVQSPDGWLHAVMGDVCGRGPDEAALGVCLRVAWRTMVLAGRPMEETLAAAVRELEAPVCLPLGIGHAERWPSAEVQLGGSWSALMYTDGLIEGKVGTGPERLGNDGLIKLIEKARAQDPPGTQEESEQNERIIDSVISNARELNGEELDDDLAVLVIGCASAAEPDRP